MKQASRDLALCGVLCALAVAIMAMGTILPVATYCAPVLASMTLLPVLVLCGEKLSWAMFFASAMLSLLLAPDKEAAAIFLALGYYPIVKPKLDQRPKIRRWIGKFLLFNVSILAVYAALRTLARQGVTELVERCCILARRFADQLSAVDGIEVLNEVVLNQVLVCFRASDGDDDAHTRRVIERVQQDGTCWMSGTTWQRRAAMRISVSNWSTDEEDVDKSVAAIVRCARE